MHVRNVLKMMLVAYVKVTAPPVLTALALQMVMLKQTVLAHAMVMVLPIVLVHAYLAL